MNDRFTFFNELENKEPRFYDVTYFSEGLCAVRIGKRWGYIDKTGNYLIEPIFYIIRPFDYDGCRIVKIGEKYDIIKVSKNG